MSEQKALTTIEQSLSTEGYVDYHKKLLLFIKGQLKETSTGENGDYGVIPYTKKKSLLKPGAEKLCRRFGLIPELELLKEIEDFSSGLVFYKYRCTLVEFKSGKKAGEAIRSCNNKEKKHASKPVFEVANTVDAVAQKRAIVAATVQALAASEIFDADTPSDFEQEAPKRKVTAEEDPRRNRLYNKLYGTASERGFGAEALHKSAQNLYGIKESLNELSNEQIEEYSEKLITTFEPVGKGEKPKKITVEVVQGTSSRDEVIKLEPTKPLEELVAEAEVITMRSCKNPDKREDCKTLLEDDNTTELCPMCRMNNFIKTGKIKKGIAV